MGWFSESDDDRRKRMGNESRIRLEKDRQTKLASIAQRKKIEKRRKADAAFQETIDAEVEKNMKVLSPEEEAAKLNQMKRSTSLLNGAMGLEYANKATNNKKTSWLDVAAMNSNGKKQASGDSDNSKASASVAAEANFPKLTRPL